MKQIGEVTHYYNKLGVAIVKLKDKLNIGDRIRFGRGETQFDQSVDSMQIDHAGVKTGKKGDEVGVKVAGKAHDGAPVFKLEEGE